MSGQVLPLFHLYGDPPDDQAFDFIHIETIASRSQPHDWLIRTHRHRNLFQILAVETGGGEMTWETSPMRFNAPCAIVVEPGVAHGFRFLADVTCGWVVSFSEDVAEAIGERAADGTARLRLLGAGPIIRLDGASELQRLSSLCDELDRERFLAPPAHRIAMRALLALVCIEVARLAASRARTGSVTLVPGDPTVEALRRLIEEHFRSERQVSFYARRFGISADRLNDLVKRTAGVTVGHLIRQRVLTEAKRELVFGGRAISDIAYDLNFADPSHFARFFRKQSGFTPQEFRTRKGR